MYYSFAWVGLSASKSQGVWRHKTNFREHSPRLICAGNICRSPAAEAVFRAKVDKAGLSDSFSIDSCGTGGGVRNWRVLLPPKIIICWCCHPFASTEVLCVGFRYKGARSYHEGGPADNRMMETAAKRNFDITSTSRPLRPEDLQKFDYILGMDFENQAAIQVAADHWAGQGKDIPTDYRNKVQLCPRTAN